MKKNFIYAEKKTKNCTRSLIYLLLLFVTCWVLCCYLYYQETEVSSISPNGDVLNYEGMQWQWQGREAIPLKSDTQAAITDRGTANDNEINTINAMEKDKEDKRGDTDGGGEGEGVDDDIHVIFSTDCSKFQDWQSLLLFHSASVVHQTSSRGGGSITRVASGCTPQKKLELEALYSTLYPVSAHHYHVHFTPDFKKDARTKKKYDFYNKPHGVLHWLEHSPQALKMPPGSVVALIDPDFIFLRRLSPRLHQPNMLLSKGVLEADVFERVGRNHPVAQFYGLGAPWVNDRNRELNRTRICGVDSPCLQVQARTASLHYSVGAPYLLEKADLLRLAKSWVQFVPRVYEGYPDLLAEMFAYSLAAAHQQLPHLRLDHFMVSNIDMDEEGWPWVDALGNAVATAPDKRGIFFPDKPLPTFLHYCQFYRAAKIGFQKRRMFGDIFSCSRGLFVDLPPGLAAVEPPHKEREGGEIVAQTRQQVRRSTFMLSVLHSALNAALRHYKSIMCNTPTSHNHTNHNSYSYTHSGAEEEGKSGSPNVKKSINLADVR